VVAGQHLHGAPVDHERAVLAVGLKAALDGRHVAAARVAAIGLQGRHRDREILDVTSYHADDYPTFCGSGVGSSRFCGRRRHAGHASLQTPIPQRLV